MKNNLQVKRVERNNRIFEFRFWEEFCGFTLYYAGVYEIFPNKKFLFWEIPNENKIRYGWGMNDRVAWCEEVLKSLFESEEQEKRDIEKVKLFCAEGCV